MRLSNFVTVGLAPAAANQVACDIVRKTVRTRGLRVCLLSPHPLVLEEFRDLLARPGFQPRSLRLESSLVPELRRLRVPRSRVYVVDAQTPRPATEALVAGILDRFPTALLLVVAEKFDEGNSFPLLRLGAKGLLTYREARAHLPRALETVAAGGFWVSRTVLSRFVESVLRSESGRRMLSGRGDLSRREREVLSALLENLSNKEIATKLFISERTAKFHVSNVLAKFGVRRRADLILLHYQGQPTGD